MNTANLKPVIRQALGDNWEKLHPVVQRHYDISANGTSRLQLHGTMYEVDHAMAIKPFIWSAQIFGALIPYRGKNVPVTVENSAIEERNTLFWRRSFHFPGRKPFYFSSRMETLRGNEIVEYVRFNLGICMAMSEKDGTLIYSSRGYLWNIGPFKLHIPDWLLLGKAEIVERGIDDETIELDFIIRHPLFGKTFTYSGNFRLNA